MRWAAEGGIMRFFERAAPVIRVVLLAASVALLIMGVLRGDPQAVLSKARVICMECIGIG